MNIKFGPLGRCVLIARLRAHHTNRYNNSDHWFLADRATTNG